MKWVISLNTEDQFLTSPTSTDLVFPPFWTSTFLKIIWSTYSMTTSWYELPLYHLWSSGNKLSKLLKRMKFSNSTKMLQRIKMLSKYRHRKAYVGEYWLCNILPSDEHKNYDHVLTSNSTNAKHISGEHDFHVAIYSYIICFLVEIKQMEILSKDFWPLTNTPEITFKWLNCNKYTYTYLYISPDYHFISCHHISF